MYFQSRGQYINNYVITEFNKLEFCMQNYVCVPALLHLHRQLMNQGC